MKVGIAGFVVGLLVCCSGVSSAATITVDATSRGWYRDDGLSNGASSVNSYTVGQIGGGDVLRNWFVFNTSGISDITSATLRLYDPSYAPGFPGFQSSVRPSETFQITNVSTPLSTLTSGVHSLAVFNELGTGDVFGTVSVSAANADAYVEVVLNAAALAALNGADDEIAFAGILSMLTGIPSDIQMEFAFSGMFAEPDWAQLVLTGTVAVAVPEPISILLFGSGLVGFAVLRRGRPNKSC